MSGSEAASALEVGAARPGRRLGRYELCAEMARGGMASVFLGRAHGLAGFEKLVAIKTIHPRYARERGFVEMFLDEARIASRITHPNVCSVFDVGDDGGVYFIAMDYLHGESLASTMRALAGRIDLVGPRWHALACAIAAEAAEGLHAAHELRDASGERLHVVHRDVSPQNVFIGYDGTVRVVDFGIARAVGRLHKTLSGVVKGKVAYMAPEQLRSEEVDRRADVWALGVVLWEMLTCERLFRRDSEGKQIRAVLEDAIPPPSSRGAGSAALDAIVLRALARSREDRWQTTRDLGRELRKYLASQGEYVSSAEIGEQMELLFREQRRNKEALIERTRRGVVEGAPDTERMDRPPADAVATEVSGPRPSTRPDDRSGRTTEREYPAMSAPPPLDPSRAAAPAPAPAPSPATPSASAVAASSGGARWRTESVVLPVRSRRLAIAGAVVALVAVGVVLVVVRSADDESGVAVEEPPAIPATAREEPAAALPSPPPSMAAAAPAPPEEPRSESSAPAGRVPEEAEPSSERRVRRGERAAKRAPDEPRPAIATAEETAPASPGRVIVGVTGGWGTITVDGRPMGQAPRAIELPPGRHVIEVMPFGEPPARREVVDVTPGGTHRVVIEP